MMIICQHNLHPAHRGSCCGGSTWVMSVITQLMNLPGAFEPTVGVGLRVEGYIKSLLTPHRCGSPTVDSVWILKEHKHIISLLSTLSEDERGFSAEGCALLVVHWQEVCSSPSVTDEYRMKGVEKVKYLSADEGGVDGSDSTVRVSPTSLTEHSLHV